MKPKRMVLFDIDGTILWGGPLWKECFLFALKHYFPQFDFPRVSFGGKTDVQICVEMMQGAGFAENQIKEHLQRVVDLYVQKASEEVANRSHEVQVLPGVPQLLEHLHQHQDVFLGLLTGNVKKGAETKLKSVGLNHYFSFGVFGDDHWNRYELPKLAVQRAEEQYGHTFEGKEIVIIGDTIHDVNCGKSIGVRTIAVGTGRNVPLESLLAQNPDYYFKDLSSLADVLTAILE